MATLLMHSEATGAVWQVWPEPEAVAPGAIQETGSYLFELRGAGAAAADLLIDDVALEALRTPGPDTARWRWLPGFHAGTVEAELRLPGAASRRFEVVTDPDLRKLTRHDFDSMVREILEDTFALFSLSSFRKGIARGAGRRPPARRRRGSCCRCARPPTGPVCPSTARGWRCNNGSWRGSGTRSGSRRRPTGC